MLSMDNRGDLTSGQNAAALVMLAFLQADCRTSEYGKELLSLGKDLNLTRDINFNGLEKDSVEDEDLETDGHLPSRFTAALDDIQPSVELQWPRNRAEAANLQQIVEGLREIADQLEHVVVAQATQNLSRNLTKSPSDQWKDHLTQEVRRAMRQGVGLEHLPQERVMMALTLTLVKGVCEQAPRLLRNLFHTALQYINPARAR
ncbi:BH3 interacting domain death agonist [Perca flavescens]|nr:BH3-interacting domain death agonist-like [Perca flavescens]